MAAIAAPVLIDLTDRADALPSPHKFREAAHQARAWELRVEAANKARDAILARKISKAEAMRTLKHEPPAPPTAALLQKLLDRLQSAEVRRDVELESIKYKAKAMAAPRKPVAVDAAKLAAELQAKLEAADRAPRRSPRRSRRPPPRRRPRRRPSRRPLASGEARRRSARRQLFLDERVTKAADMASPSKAPKPAPEALKAAHDAMIADHGARHDHEIEQRVAKAHVASAKVARAEQKRAAKIDDERIKLREKMAAAAERRAAAARQVDKAATEEKPGGQGAQGRAGPGTRRPPMTARRPRLKLPAPT